MQSLVDSNKAFAANFNSHSIFLDNMSSIQLNNHVMLCFEQLALRLGTKRYNEWGVIRLETCHYWGSAGLHSQPSALPHLH